MRRFIMLLALLAGITHAINVSGCQQISSAGTYDLVADLQGANISAPELSASGMACLRVAANNVVIDCHGHSVTDNSTGNYRYGIMTRSNFTTIRNCAVSGYGGSVNAGIAVLQNSSLTVSRKIYFPTVDNVTCFNNYYGFYTYNYDSGSDFYGIRGLLLANSTFYGNRYGVYMSSYATNFTWKNNNASNNNYSGFYTTNLGARNVTIINNTASFNLGNTSGSAGFYLEGMNWNVTILNNTAEGNSYYGIYYRSLNTTVANNIFNGNGGHGMYGDPFFSGPAYYIIQNNTALRNNMSGIIQTGYPEAGSSFLFQNNTAAYNLQDGIILYGYIHGSVLDNTAENNSGSGIRYTSYFGGDGGLTLNATFNRNRAYNNTEGFSIYTGASPPSNMTFQNNTALENTHFDYYMTAYGIGTAPYCDVIRLVNMTSSGGRQIVLLNASGDIRDLDFAELVLCDTDSSTVSNVTIHGSDLIPNNGILLHMTDDTAFENLSMSDDFASFDLIQSHRNRFRDISVAGSVFGVMNYHYFTACCPTFHSSENNTFTDMNFTGCGTAYYFDFNSLGRNNVTGGLVRDSYGPGMVINTSLVFLNGTHFCNNNPDMRTFASSGFAAYIGLNSSNLIFDSPSCNYSNFANASITDTGSTANYTINWTAAPPSPPSGRFAFKGFLNFTRITSSAIDRMVFSWRDDELGGNSESLFRLYRYDTVWTSMNTSPNTAQNTLSLFSVSTFSSFGILGSDSAPVVTLNSPPSSSSFFNTTSLNLTFTATDNSPTLNCTLYLDYSPNQTNASVTQGVATIFTASGLSSGWHYWQVRCTDAVGGIGSSSAFSFEIDNTPPEIYLDSPANGSSIPVEDANPLYLYYNVTDAQSTMASCSLYLDGALNATYYSVYVSEGTPNFEVYGLASGPHNWSVECNDSYFSGRSGTWYFDIFQPGVLCDAHLVIPSGNAQVQQNGFFNVTSTIGCCGGSTNCSVISATLDPDYAPQSCSSVWGFNCGDNPDSDNTFDGCSNHGVYADEHVGEAYLNGTSFAAGEEVLATCYFVQTYNSDYAYAWYYNGTGWRQIGSWSSQFPSCGSACNFSVVFTPDSVVGTHWVRCGITYSSQDYDECIDSSANYHDNDDISFAVENTAISVADAWVEPSLIGMNMTASCAANITSENPVAWVRFNITYPDLSVLELGDGAFSEGVWHSANFTATLSGEYACSVVASDNESNTASSEVYFSTGTKGAVPEGSGSPFYTIDSNPASGGCLASIAPGTYCNTTWQVNATGAAHSTWEFFVTYLADDGGEPLIIDTPPLNITIISNATAVPSGEDDDDEPDPPLSISVESACGGNFATITSRGNAVSGATVKQDGDMVGMTDDSGRVALPEGCDKLVRISAVLSGYRQGFARAQLIGCLACETPEPPPVEPIVCDCGFLFEGRCVDYECCHNDVCPETEYCDIPKGQAGGVCRPVSGECGTVGNHTFVPYGYQCGAEPGCPSCPADSRCEAHKCVGNDLSCPTTGIVGDNKTCEARENEGPCANCDYIVTDPTGRNFTGRTDEKGNFGLPLTIEGIYKVALMKNGSILKVIEVKAFPQAQPIEPEKDDQSTKKDDSWLLWLIILLALLFLAILYWRRGKKEKNTAPASGKKPAPSKQGPA